MTAAAPVRAALASLRCAARPIARTPCRRHYASEKGSKRAPPPPPPAAPSSQPPARVAPPKATPAKAADAKAAEAKATPAKAADAKAAPAKAADTKSAPAKAADAARSSFQGQLYDSVFQRIQRENQEQMRFAAIRAYKKRGTQWFLPVVMAVGALAGYAYSAQRPRALAPGSTLPLADADAPFHDLAPMNLQACWTDMRDIVGLENVSTQADDCAAHAGSDWSTFQTPPDKVPFMVVRPKTTEEVSEIMKVCHRRKLPVTAYSGGTSLEGHFAPTFGGICIDFSRMDQILALHEDDLDVVVQPAVGWENLNEHLATKNLFFPPDPGPGAMIGGMVGTGCSGTNAYRYGTMKDWVLSLTVVLADGTIIKTKQRPRKSSAGYDLTRVFVGSEGTLGLVTEAVLKVTPRPQKTSVAVAAFPSIRAAADCVSRVVKAGVPIAAIEILDDVQMRCINAAGATSRTWAEQPTLFFKFAGTPSSVQEHIAQVRDLARGTGSRSFEFARSAAEADELWSARKEALWSVMAQKRPDGGDHVWTTDVAVPISKLPDLIDETKADLTRSGLTGAIVGHVGDGNFHAILLYNETERDVAEAVVHRMVKRAIELEGTATGEHGVGLVKRDYLNHELGESTVDMMRKMKQAFDPRCILNCDKVVRMSQPAKGEVQKW